MISKTFLLLIVLSIFRLNGMPNEAHKNRQIFRPQNSAKWFKADRAKQAKKALKMQLNFLQIIV